MPVDVRNVFPYIIKEVSERYFIDEKVFIHNTADSDGCGDTRAGEPDGL